MAKVQLNSLVYLRLGFVQSWKWAFYHRCEVYALILLFDLFECLSHLIITPHTPRFEFNSV